MTYPNIIGLSGVARAGKDTVGVVLHDLYGYEIRSFSDILNETLIALNPFVGPKVSATDLRFARYADVIEDYGYEGAKEFPEIRALLQRMGTEVGRRFFGEDVWVDAMFAKYKPGMKWAIVNVRFPNEYQAVKDYDGEVWHVSRPGYEPAQGHISDRALEGYTFDFNINNNGTVKDLADKVMDRLDGADPRSHLQRAFNGGSREG